MRQTALAVGGRRGTLKRGNGDSLLVQSLGVRWPSSAPEPRRPFHSYHGRPYGQGSLPKRRAISVGNSLPPLSVCRGTARSLGWTWRESNIILLRTYLGTSICTALWQAIPSWATGRWSQGCRFAPPHHRHRRPHDSPC